MNRLKRGIKELVTSYNQESKAIRATIACMMLTSLFGVIGEASGLINNHIVLIGYTSAVVVSYATFVCLLVPKIIQECHEKKK